MKQTKNSIKDSKPSENSSSYQVESRLKSGNSPENSKSLPKQTALDLKKINLNKNPTQSNSSLQLLILLLYKSLKLSLQQILGLFTNQNKYLAHIVVKGINEDFTGIKEFYTLINENVDTLLRLYEEDHDDTFACLYAIKPGFISKDEQVSELTLTLFDQFSDIYNWFVGKEAKCSNTFLLGIKRHENIVQKYAGVLFNLISGHEVQFFETHYISSISSTHEFLHITTMLLKYMALNYDKASSDGQKSIIDLLQEKGVFQKWFQMALQFYQGPLDDKLIVLQFFGDFMLYLPQVVDKNLIILNSLRHNWVSFKMPTFVPLFNQLLIVLEKVANAKSNMAKKLYSIIVEIFNDTYEIQDKRQFIVNSFFSILSQFPNIPSELFIKNYQSNKLNPTDFLLICQAIDISADENNLIKIGQILKDIFFFDVIANYFTGNLIPEIIKKIIGSQTKEVFDFVTNLFKSILSNYVAFVIKIKSQPKITSDDTFFGKKKHLQKAAQQEKNDSIICNKSADLTVDLCERIVDVLIQIELPQSYLNTLKKYILITNSEVKRNNFGMGTKRLWNILQKKFKVTKEQEQEFEEENKQNLHKSGFRLSDSVISKKARDTYGAISSLSRVQVPQRVTKEFDEIIAKRKRDEVQKVEHEVRKKKEQELKKIIQKKELEKINLIKGGFGEGQAQLKEEGFWNKFIKETQQVKVYTNNQMEDAHLQAADLIIKKYNKLFKYFFFNYSSTMYSNKVTNFDQNLLRKETLNAVEIIKFLKDYNLIFLASLQQIQTLVKEINIKILHRKQVVNELDYEGFQEFIRQFCLCVWNKNQRVVGPQEYSLKMDHLMLPEILHNLLDHLKNTFKSKGSNMIFFDIGELDTQNVTVEIQQMNEILRENPNYILPQGFKKITDKKIQFKPSIKEAFNVTDKFKVAYEVLDQIIYEKFAFHIIEPHSQKVVKVTAKPFHQINVRDRDPTKIKARALSTIIDRKTASHTSLGNHLTKNDLSKGTKKAMLLLKNQDKIVGQQVAFVLERMLTEIASQIDKQIVPLNKLKSQNKSGQVQKRRGLTHRKVESLHQIPVEKLGKTMNLGKKFEKIKSEMIQKRQHKLQEQKKKEQEIENKQRKKKQQQERYYQELKQKIQEKKRIQQEQQVKKDPTQQQKQKRKAARQKFQNFNSKQVDRLKKQFQDVSLKKKKQEQDRQVQNEQLEDKKKKIRTKIETDDKFITQIRKQTLEAIIEISFSQNFKNLTQQYSIPLKTVFHYLQKLGLDPLALKKCPPGQIDYDTWIKFNKIFQISPLIVNSKDLIAIFKAVTKDKRVSKDYLVGLSFNQFLNCLLRQCIKKKTIFSKILQRVKEDKPPTVVQGKKKKKKTPTKVQPKNQFEEEEELNIKKLLQEPDVRDDIIDHYGDISKFNVDYFKGLIYYLRMPFTKRGQEKRVKELVQIQEKSEVNVSNIQKLKDKLKAQYTLERAQPQKKQQKTQTKLQSRLQAKESKEQKTETKSIKGQTKQNIEKEEVKSKKSFKK